MSLIRLAASVTVIDGTNNSTTTVAAGSGPIAVAVNPVTNKIYVANDNSDERYGDYARADQRHSA